jgi:hypothetical protein
MEFKCFVIWGRVWVAQMLYWTEDETWPGADTFGYVYRNGGMAAGGEFDTFPFKGVEDWEHLVEVAETFERPQGHVARRYICGCPLSDRV